MRWPSCSSGLKLAHLRHQIGNQILGEDLRQPCDVEDVFLRVERRQLPAELRKRVHDARRHAAHARVKSGEQTGRARADDRDVPYVQRHEVRER